MQPLWFRPPDLSLVDDHKSDRPTKRLSMPVLSNSTEYSFLVRDLTFEDEIIKINSWRKKMT